MVRNCCLVLTLLFALSSSANAQRAENPDAAARRGLEAMRRLDYDSYARMTDPVELRRNKALFDSLIRADTANYLAKRFFRRDSSAHLLRMSDAEFTAGLMRFQFGLRGSSAFFKDVRGIDIIGSLMQGRDTAHIIYRWKFPPDSLPIRSYSVHTVVRCGPQWCSHMAGDYRQMADLLKQPMVPVPINRE